MSECNHYISRSGLDHNGPYWCWLCKKFFEVKEIVPETKKEEVCEQQSSA